MDHPKIEVVTSFTHLRIYINGLLHFSVILDELVGIQSWIVSQRSYRIEYYLKSRKIICEYDSRQTWESILKGLHEIDII